MDTTPDLDKTILSEHDVMRMQMIEAAPDNKETVENAKREFPDMSYGWYTSPVTPEDSRDL